MNLLQSDMIQAHSRRNGNYALLPVATAAVATGIFIADTVAHVNIPVGVFYVAVVLLTARFCRARGVVLVAAGCVGLTVLSYFLSHPAAPEALGVTNLLIGIGVIGVTTLLALQSQSAEETLREQANLLDLTHDTIFVRDMHDGITYWSRGAEDLYGWVRDEAVGKVTHQLLQTTFPAPLEDINAELLRSGRWEGELVHTKRDGTRVVVASRWALRRNEQENPIAILETNNDITERRQATDSLREVQMQLAHVNRVATMGQLTASIAHEVNQPIAATVTNADAALRWLGTHPPDLAEVKAALARIVKDGKRAGDVIGRIRALIKKVPPHKDQLDVHESILEVIALTRSELLRNGVSLQTHFAKGLPSVEGDRIQLQQVILNLIMNAVEAMSGLTEGARELRISTETEAGGGVLVTVRDSGPGLDPMSVDRVFETFYTTKPEGMGMGLAICRSIIEAHGGRMRATPNEPRGAVFQFTLASEWGETAPTGRAA